MSVDSGGKRIVMKQKTHARDRREAAKTAWNRKLEKKEKLKEPQTVLAAKKPELTAEECSKIEEEETRLFLEHISRTDLRIVKEELALRNKVSRKARLEEINLEEGMPIVEDALARMKQGLLLVKHQKVALVKLIHGYGSSGTGGSIRISVREELSAMKKRKLIKGFIIGEDFGPFSEETRNLVDKDRRIREDRDYGRCNHGITIVIL